MSKQDWSVVQSLRESGEITYVSITEPAQDAGGNFCGAHAPVGGLKGFIPFRELNLRVKPETLKGMEVPVKVLEADPKGGKKNSGRLILSRVKAVEELQQTLIGTLKAGDRIKGTVLKSIGSGVLVDLGSFVTGHVHRSELSSDRSKDPNDVVQPGDVKEFEVLKVEAEQAHVRLSLRKVEEPRFIERLAVGQQCHAKVVRLESYGAFVDLGGPVDGLLHRSKLPKGTKLSDLQPGAEMLLEVVSLDAAARRIGVAPVAQEGEVQEQETPVVADNAQQPCVSEPAAEGVPASLLSHCEDAGVVASV